MIWEHWTTRQLQSSLHEVDPELYDNIKDILPPLRGDSYNPIEIDSKENLRKLVQAFSPSDYFSKKKNMKACLEKLPPKTMREFARELNKHGFSIDHRDFPKSLAQISKISWREKKFSELFLEFFSLPKHFMHPEVDKLPDYIDVNPLSSENPLILNTPFKSLIDYQHQVYTDAMKKLEVDRARFIVQMPTGSGKTRTSMEIISQHMNKAPEGNIVLWLAHSSELCEQAFQCFIEVWQHLARKDTKAIRCWGKHPQPVAYSKSMFIVGGFQKIHSLLKDENSNLLQLKERISLIVIDEAHKAVAPTYKNAITTLRGKNTQVIGLTATPGRTETEETEEMAEFFFESKVSIKTSTGISEIEMLKERKVLAQIDYVPIKTPVDFELTPAQLRSLEKSFDFPRGFLNKVASSNVRNIEILKKLLQSCSENRQILFFGVNVKHSKFIMSMLTYFGIKTAHIDGSTATNLRQQSIEDFKNGRIQVLCNYGVLTTGFDAPNTDEVFISRPTNSVVLYSQMIGRGLRGTTIGGTERCRISDVKDNITGFGDQVRVYHWFEDFWDN